MRRVYVRPVLVAMGLLALSLSGCHETDSIGGDAGVDASVDVTFSDGGGPDTGTPDGGTPDGGTPDTSPEVSPDTGPSITPPEGFGISAGGAATATTRFRMSLSVGGPVPTGQLQSPRFRARIGVGVPQMATGQGQ